MREVLGRTPLAESAFAAGVLADVGALLLVTRPPIEAAAVARAVQGGKLPWVAEQERLGCTHAELGAAILAKWNLPNTLVEAVALHHQPPENVPVANVASALALVSAVEFSHRTAGDAHRELRLAAERLITTFPTASLEQLDRYFAPGDEAVA